MATDHSQTAPQSAVSAQTSTIETATREDLLSADTAVPDPVTDGTARRGTGFWRIAQSVGAAMIGVQSRKNRERDFTEGKPLHFIIGGLVGTGLFLLVVWLLVQYLLATS